MKKILVLPVLFIVLMSASAFAKISVLAAEGAYCNLILPEGLSVIAAPAVNVGSVTLDLAALKEPLTYSLEKWMIEFDIAKDPVISTDQKPLCFGFYNDVKGANALAYKDEAIVFGARLLEELPTMSRADYNDAAKFILAHEFAHNLQFRHGLKFDYVLPMLSTKIKELQADCIAGYMLRAHNEVVFDTQVKLKTLIAAIGDPHSVGDHGMAGDRELAFQRGMSFAAHDMLLGKKVFQVKSADIINHCNAFYSVSK